MPDPPGRLQRSNVDPDTVAASWPPCISAASLSGFLLLQTPRRDKQPRLGMAIFKPIGLSSVWPQRGEIGQSERTFQKSVILLTEMKVKEIFLKHL